MALWQQTLNSLWKLNAPQRPKNAVDVLQWTLHIVDAKTGKTIAFSEVNEVFSPSQNRLATDTFQMYLDKWHILTDFTANEIHQKILKNEWIYLDRPKPRMVIGTQEVVSQTQSHVQDILQRSLLSANPGASKLN